MRFREFEGGGVDGVFRPNFEGGRSMRFREFEGG